ncbi:MAG: sulfite exporter TauE/SafE family protein [Clostridia bacterium]|nr:sulfite exporter TauE/SafE family protein [Clostridia bacterium]
MSVFLPILAGFLAGIFGAMGLGGGSVLIIYLTVFAGVKQLAAQGINLIFFLPTAAVAVFVYSKKRIIKWRTILPVMIFGAIGTLVTGFWVGNLNSELVKKLFGIVIVFYGLYELFAQKSTNKPPTNHHNIRKKRM